MKTDEKKKTRRKKKKDTGLTTRHRLIRAAIEEISLYGLKSFSVRRVAQKCNVSCAAPYKHFKNKQAIYAAIIEHILELWHKRQEEFLAGKEFTLREELVALSLEYIRFMVENPYFRSILMLKDDQLDAEILKNKRQISPVTADVLHRYCSEVKMPEETALRKTYIVRSLIYGASLMIDSGELPYTPQILSIVQEVIDREFDLP